MTQTSSQIAQPEASMMRRAVAAATIGQIVEWYDYAVYGYLAATLAVVFFPTGNPTTALLATFAGFAVAFFFRPLGGIIFGHFGDKFGRQPTLAAVILLVSGATFLIGVLPTYASLGLLSPILLVLLRLLQGLSAGGEYVGSASFVGEYSPVSRRGFLCSWMLFGSTAGLLIGSVVATLLSLNLSEVAMNSWGWRIPFLIAGPLGLIGLYIRLKLEDTPNFRTLEVSNEVAQNPLRQTLSRGEHYKQLGLTLGIACIQALAFYLLLTYMPTYLSETLNFGRVEAFLSLTIAMVVLVIAIPFMGALSDRVGRKPMMIGTCTGFLILVYPCFLLISQGGLLNAMVGQTILALVASAYSATSPSVFAELFPTRVRYSGLGIGYNIGSALFGGTAPFVAVLLVSATGNNFAPAFYLMAGALVSLITVLMIQETANKPLRNL